MNQHPPSVQDASASAAPARGIAMVATVEIGEGGVKLLVGNGLLKQDQVGDRHAVGEACLENLAVWDRKHKL